MAAARDMPDPTLASYGCQRAGYALWSWASPPMNCFSEMQGSPLTVADVAGLVRERAQDTGRELGLSPPFAEHLSVHGHGQVPRRPSARPFRNRGRRTGADPRVRRLLATFWLLMLFPGGPAHRRNHPVPSSTRRSACSTCWA